MAEYFVVNTCWNITVFVTILELLSVILDELASIFLACVFTPSRFTNKYAKVSGSLFLQRFILCAVSFWLFIFEAVYFVRSFFLTIYFCNGFYCGSFFGFDYLINSNYLFINMQEKVSQMLIYTWHSINKQRIGCVNYSAKQYQLDVVSEELHDLTNNIVSLLRGAWGQCPPNVYLCPPNFGLLKMLFLEFHATIRRHWWKKE